MSTTPQHDALYHIVKRRLINMVAFFGQPEEGKPLKGDSPRDNFERGPRSLEGWKSQIN
jgi:hypothetical protein